MTSTNDSIKHGSESSSGYIQQKNSHNKIMDKLLLFLKVAKLCFFLVPFSVAQKIFQRIFPSKGKQLRGQVVLVTGGGRGLGKGLAISLAIEEGCKVAVADINIDNAEQTAADIVKAGGQAKAYFANVAKVEDVRELQKAISRDLGSVDILINNAGLVEGEPVENYSDAAIQTYLDVNLTSHFWTVRAFLPDMKVRNSGHIVAISSICAFLTGPNGTAYSASKSGVKGFMDCLHVELNQRVNNNIKTSCVFPYFFVNNAVYENSWNCRWPPMSLEETVEAIITGIKRDDVYITIPDCAYLVLHLYMLLPQKVYEKIQEMLYVTFRIPSKDEKQNILVYKIIEEQNKGQNLELRK